MSEDVKYEKHTEHRVDVTVEAVSTMSHSDACLRLVCNLRKLADKIEAEVDARASVMAP